MRTSQTVPGFAGLLVVHALLVAPVCAAPADSTSAAVAGPGAPGSHLAITEVGVSTTIGNTRNGGDPLCGDIALGYLGRTGKRTMLGGEVGILTRDAGTSIALRPRLQRELGGHCSMNLAAGPVVYGTVDTEELDGVGLSVAAGFDYRGSVGVRFEMQRLGYVGYRASTYPDAVRENVTTTMVGVRLGRAPGRVAIVGLALLAVIALASGPYDLGPGRTTD